MMISSLIYPLEYIGDIRPYFTIYEKDFKDYLDEEDLCFNNAAILGVINPFCLRVWFNITNVIVIRKMASNHELK